MEIAMPPPIAPPSSNRLLQVLILLSLGAHLILFLHLTDMLEKGPISYIELTMHETVQPRIRAIPKPRPRQQAPEIHPVRQVRVKPFRAPKINIKPLAPDIPEHLTEAISAPEVPAGLSTAGLQIPVLNVPVPKMVVDEPEYAYSTPKEYFDMVQLRIEQFKKYPQIAKSRHIEGRVKITFTIDRKGEVLAVNIARKSRHRHLNRAAVEAIKEASPFPGPPSHLFKKTPLTFNVTVTFEIT
ncbi:MAG: energy transducer TonB [Desulfobacteraceae bacterium]|nr:MAG: energy transducer TonB [Desulfobacteraceae bacterium]